MQISPNGVKLIEQSEGLRLSVYLDNGKNCIGYGHDLLPGESFSNGIDQSEALALLEKDVAPLLNVIERVCPQANQNQIDALCDFGYNLGIGDLETMLGHGFDQIPIQMPRWDYNKGVPDENILARREREVALFNTPVA
jgi:GH24 family phage-related lysozyme (muramidase)